MAGEWFTDGSPVAGSHNRTVPSSPAEASRSPSGLNATPITAPSWPVERVTDGSPVAGSHNRTVPSAPAEASRRPVRAERHPTTHAGVAGEGFTDASPVAGSHNRTVPSVAGGGEQDAVGAERHRHTDAVVAGEWFTDGVAGGRVPQPHRAIALAEASSRPSGLNATAAVPVVCRASGSPTGCRWPGPTTAPCHRRWRRRAACRRG